MKRYRVLRFEFDSRALILEQEIQDTWEDSVQENWRQNKEQIRNGLVDQFGQWASEQKIKNFVDLGPKPFSIMAFHNTFLSDCRDAFVVGGYYPALTGACALGERILNHLILILRDDFRATPEYKRVYRKESFDNWQLAIDTLVAWDVLLPEAADRLRELSAVRNRTIHFHPETDTNDREMALEALRLLQEIVQDQFGSFGPQPWFITEIAGEAFIRKSWEAQPFIQRVYLPNCALVGPLHHLEADDLGFVVHDDNVYLEVDVSDEEFARMREARSLEA
jgi:hypothetical protein